MTVCLVFLNYHLKMWLHCRLNKDLLNSITQIRWGKLLEAFSQTTCHILLGYLVQTKSWPAGYYEENVKRLASAAKFSEETNRRHSLTNSFASSPTKHNLNTYTLNVVLPLNWAFSLIIWFNDFKELTRFSRDLVRIILCVTHSRLSRATRT